MILAFDWSLFFEAQQAVLLVAIYWLLYARLGGNDE